MVDLLIGGGTVVTLGAANQCLAGGAVLVRDQQILAVDTERALRAQYPAAQFVDAHGGLIMPGFLCTHTHFYGAFARGMAIPGEPPQNFPQILQQLWWRLDKALTPEDISASARIFQVDAIRHGTTCMIDHHASPAAIDGSLDLIAEEVIASGLRACLAYEVSDRDGAGVSEAGMRENERFVQALRTRFQTPASQGRLAASYGLHASFTLGPQTLERCAAAGASLGVGFHIHVAEDRSDEEDSQARYGRPVVERLLHEHLLGPRSIAAHCVHVHSGEIGTLAGTRTNCVHNPRSNMNNAVGCAPVPALLAAGVNVGLGNDGFSMDMLQEMKEAYLMHKLVAADPRVLPGEMVLELAFAHNARIIEAVFGPFASKRLLVGELCAGAAADLILLDYYPPTPLHSGNLPWHLLFGVDARHVNATMVAGRWLMRDRQLVALDEQRIHAQAHELASALWKRI